MNDNVKVKSDTITLRQLKARNRKLKKQLRAEKRKLTLMEHLALENANLPSRIRSLKEEVKEKERSLYLDSYNSYTPYA